MYVDQPEGFIKQGEEDKVYKLNKALHGLKQAPRTWFNMKDCNSVKNPIVPGTVLSKEGEMSVNPTLYKQLVGSLMYVTVTRPDIMYVIGLTSRYMTDPKEEHMQIAKRVLRYLKGTLNFGLWYGRVDKLKLTAHTDSDYARDIDDRKSISGYVFMINNVAVNWSSKKQEIVSLSSTEAEYVAATASACHSVWIKEVLKLILVRRYDRS